MSDFEVQNHGTVFLFIPLTERARECMRESIRPEPWQRLGDGFAVEHGVAFDLAQALVRDGFLVE